jgi:hypothetical protein
LDIPAALRRREQRVAALQRARQVIEERARELGFQNLACVSRFLRNTRFADKL